MHLLIKWLHHLVRPSISNARHMLKIHL